jgi:DNA repair protein RadC
VLFFSKSVSAIRFVANGIDRIYFCVDELIKFAIHHRAESMMLVHNHPSGETAPSLEDINTERRLAEIFSKINVKLTHSLIVAEFKYSLRALELQ